MKKNKAGVLTKEHKNVLAVLSSKPEFGGLEELFRIEEKNIVVGSFKVRSDDPLLMTKKAHFEGRLYEIRKILKTFKEVKKENEDSDE